MQQAKKSYAEYLYEIKENCPQLRNVIMPSKSCLMNDLNVIAAQVPLEKKANVVRICAQQEQRIYQSLHQIKSFNLLNEIGRVNPQLQKELRETKTADLPQRLEHYQRIKNDADSESYTQEYLRQETFFEDSYKKPTGVTIRNLMDEYENTELSDLYISKYFDLN